MLKVLCVYLIVINIVALCLYGADKSAAIRGRRRIPNKVLLCLAVIGGSVGALAGMYVFRHKTKTWYYTIPVPVILLLQIAAAVLLLSGCSSTPAQIILRWHIQDRYIAIPGSSNPDHIEENYNIFDFELTDEDMERIRALDRRERYENW